MKNIEELIEDLGDNFLCLYKTNHREGNWVAYKKNYHIDRPPLTYVKYGNTPKEALEKLYHAINTKENQTVL